MALSLPLQQNAFVLIYPFQVPPERQWSDVQLRQLNKWESWWCRLKNRPESGTVGDLEWAYDDSYFFVPRIRGLFFPETKSEADEMADYAQPLKYLPTAVTHLTLKAGFEDIFQNTEVTSSRQNFHGRLKFLWCDVFLFPGGVGFMVLKFSALPPQGQSMTSSLLADTIRIVRSVHAMNVAWQLPDWKLSSGASSIICQAHEWVDYLLEEIIYGESNSSNWTIEQFCNARRGRSERRYSQSEDGQIYGQTFRVYSYSCLDRILWMTLPPAINPTFTDDGEQVLFDVATAGDSTHPNYRPHPLEVKSLFERGGIYLWENWRGLVLDDNVAIVGLEKSNFTEGSLPGIVFSDYLQLYLLCLYQKFQLNYFAGELTRDDTKLRQNIMEARRLWKAFFSFRNSFWVEEATLKPQGKTIYRTFWRVLNSASLYATISSEVRETREFFDSRVSRKTEQILRFLAFIGFPTTIVLDIFSESWWLKLDADHHPWLLFLILLIYGFSGACWYCWHRFSNSND